MISVHLPESRGMCKTIISACSNDNLIVNISFLVAFLYTDTKTKDYIYIINTLTQTALDAKIFLLVLNDRPSINASWPF